MNGFLALGGRARPVRHHSYCSACYHHTISFTGPWWEWLLILIGIIALSLFIAAVSGIRR